MLNPEEDQKFNKKINAKSCDEEWPNLNIEELSEYQ